MEDLEDEEELYEEGEDGNIPNRNAVKAYASALVSKTDKSKATDTPARGKLIAFLHELGHL